jgi:hypothetical protein
LAQAIEVAISVEDEEVSNLLLLFPFVAVSRAEFSPLFCSDLRVRNNDNLGTIDRSGALHGAKTNLTLSSLVSLWHSELVDSLCLTQFLELSSL